jgi:hypothetical protein
MVIHGTAITMRFLADGIYVMDAILYIRSTFTIKMEKEYSMKRERKKDK